MGGIDFDVKGGCVCPTCNSVHVERTRDGWRVGCDCKELLPFVRDDMRAAFEAFLENRRYVSECGHPICPACSDAPYRCFDGCYFTEP